MNAVDLLRDLVCRGVQVVSVDDELHVDAPRGVLSPVDYAALRTSKPALLALLREAPIVPRRPTRYLGAHADPTEYSGAAGDGAHTAAPPHLIPGMVEIIGIADPCLLCGGVEYRLPATANGFVHCVRCTDPPLPRRRS